ncbi:hypothetical protein ACLOJK_031333 [Asimina triloba]
MGIFGMILVVFFMGFIAWIYQAIQPPPPKVCGSANGRPPVTAPRIKLSNGRHGTPIISQSHAFSLVVDLADVMAGFQELMEELGIYLLSFDRPGYGESDPNPKKTGKNIASDIEELADQLDLGSKFYIVVIVIVVVIVIISCFPPMWGQLHRSVDPVAPPMWSMDIASYHTKLDFGNDVNATHHVLVSTSNVEFMSLLLAQLLAGVALLAPVINFWWRGIPANISNEAYKAQLAAANPEILSFEDKKLVFKLAGMKEYQEYQAQIRQQGEFESIHRDMIVGFGRWEFSPIDLENPFPANEGSVHLWQGDEDLLVPVTLQRYIAEKLSWIRYHEVPGAGHLLILADGFPDTVVKALLLGH